MLDADVFLTETTALKYLVNKDMLVVAPMLVSDGPYSNFWLAYYKYNISFIDNTFHNLGIYVKLHIKIFAINCVFNMFQRQYHAQLCIYLHNLCKYLDLNTLK